MEQEKPVETPPVENFQDTSNTSSSTSSSELTKIFSNAEGLRAGWRLLLYLLITAGFFLGLKILLMQFYRPTPGKFSFESLLFSEMIGFISAFGAAVMMSFVEHRPVGCYGLPVQQAFGKLFWQGFLLGFLEISVLVGLIYAFGGYSFGPLALHGSQLVHWCILWLLCLTFVGLFEEFLFRGYSLFTLGSGIGFWPAAILLCLLFAAVHLQNSGEGRVGVAGVFVVGLLWCFTVRRTGSLWLAVGMHAAFDFGETFFYSVPDSGMVLPGHLSDATLHGPLWLTGGSAGPEASVFDFLLLFFFFYVIHRLYPAKKSPQHADGSFYRTNSETNTNFTP
jgi:membrane protease YdiL (CAAX protease family)